MAAATNISSAGGPPQVTVSGGALIRYTCRFFLVKPQGQVWPGTNSRTKKIHQVTLNKDHPPTDTFTLGDPQNLRGLFLLWVIDMRVPGGGGPEPFFVEVEIKQDGSDVMNPSWTKQGQVTNLDSVDDDTDLRVTP